MAVARVDATLPTGEGKTVLTPELHSSLHPVDLHSCLVERRSRGFEVQLWTNSFDGELWASWGRAAFWELWFSVAAQFGVVAARTEQGTTAPRGLRVVPRLHSRATKAGWAVGFEPLSRFLGDYFEFWVRKWNLYGLSVSLHTTPLPLES